MEGRVRGKIIGLREGYGFIKPDGGGMDVFFLKTVLLDTHFSQLEIGMPVEYGVVQHEKGLRAEDVRVLSEVA